MSSFPQLMEGRFLQGCAIISNYSIQSQRMRVTSKQKDLPYLFTSIRKKKFFKSKTHVQWDFTSPFPTGRCTKTSFCSYLLAYTDLHIMIEQDSCLTDTSMWPDPRTSSSFWQELPVPASQLWKPLSSSSAFGRSLNVKFAPSCACVKCSYFSSVSLIELFLARFFLAPVVI